jgi:ABC-type multidrug transport system ATPase subunit
MHPGFVIDTAWKSFGRRDVLKNASAWSVPGRVTLLLGRNGCGKSTLLRCATGQYRWEKGSVFIDGRQLVPDLAFLSSLGVFYWPDADLLSRRRTIGWHLAALSARAGTAASPPAACEPFLDRRPGEISGGERRWCELALVEGARPRFLLADEPLLGVQPAGRGEFCAALRRLAAGGAAVLVTGHEVEDLLEAADDVIWMVAGTTHHLGTPAEARAHWQFRSEYLGMRAAL